jgi:octaprenyl-diphosphate synthase
VASLAGCTASQQDAAFAYGRHLGICFQIVDDVLDVVASTEALGKESAVDMKVCNTLSNSFF